MQHLGYSEKNKILLALSLTKGIGNQTILKLFENEAECSLEIVERNLTSKLFTKFVEEYSNIDKCTNYLLNYKIGIFSYYDSFYPENLKLLEDPPVVLYFRSNKYTFHDLPFLFSKSRFAIVGSRTVAPITEKIISDLLKHLSATEIVTISGMAYGADSFCHQYSISNKLPTIAVLAGGVNFPSPAGNSDIYSKIVEAGLIISDQHPQRKIVEGSFVRRNRIVAGMSDILLVAQAAKNSGSIITPTLAYPLGIKIFAVTSNPYDNDFTGCHELISQNIAKIYTGLECISDAFGFSLNKVSNYSTYSKNEKRILDFILSEGLVSLDEIATALDIDLSDLNMLMMKFEIDGVVNTNLSGLYYLK